MKKPFLAGLVGSICLFAAAELLSAQLSFQAAGNEFTFDTGVLRGKLRAGGKANGLSAVFHIPSGTRLDASLGLFSHYRVFTAGKRYGTAAWDWPAESKLNPNGSVETRWPATPERPFELRATYRWTAPHMLDLQTAVDAKADLPAFEVFLASYFSHWFTNALVYTDRAHPVFQPVLPEFGTWQAFPKDAAATTLIQDGRWKLEPNPVDWTIRPLLAAPLAVRRAPALQLCGVVMAAPHDCFAVCTPHQLETHYSTYLSLFGQELKRGTVRVARTGLLIAKRLSDEQLADGYKAFLTPP